MGDGWSLGRKDLIESESTTNHPDPRMHLRIGKGEIDSYGITDPSRRTEVLRLNYPGRKPEELPPVEMTKEKEVDGVIMVARVLLKIASEVEQDTYGEVEHGETKKKYQAIIKSGSRTSARLFRQLSAALEMALKP